jgi:hypothetical protein
MPARHLLSRLAITIVFATACLPPEPDQPPDEDTTAADATAEDGGPPPFPGVINDGEGQGVIIGPYYFDEDNAVIIGAPTEAVGALAEAGQVSVIVPEGGGGIGIPDDLPSTIIEDDNYSGCNDSHQFAYYLGSDREYGSAFSFYSGEIGVDAADFRGGLITGAPVAGADSGRIMQFEAFTPCWSCVMFPRSPDSDALYGDEFGTLFGSSIAVGFFERSNPTPTTPTEWFVEAEEHLAVGAPNFDGAGGVHIYEPESYQDWRPLFEQDGDDQCEFPFAGPSAWRIRTLAGAQVGEEFGKTMAAADFNCDGFDDLAIGAPGATILDEDPVPNAGMVYIYYGGDNGIGVEGLLTIMQGDFGVGGEPERDDRFGTALTVGNFDGSRLDNEFAWNCWDLAVGTPNEDNGAGEVQIFYGSPDGLTVTGPILRLGEDSLIGERNAGDAFGRSLVSESYTTDDAFHDLVIGAPGDETGGSVVLVPGSANGPDNERSTILFQGIDTIPHDNEPGDQFGFAVSHSFDGTGGEQADVVVVGVPGEDVGVGAVFLVRVQDDEGSIVPTSTAVWFQDQISGDLATVDRFGAVLAQPRAFPRLPYAFIP